MNTKVILAALNQLVKSEFFSLTIITFVAGLLFYFDAGRRGVDQDRIKALEVQVEQCNDRIIQYLGSDRGELVEAVHDLEHHVEDLEKAINNLKQ